MEALYNRTPLRQLTRLNSVVFMSILLALVFAVAAATKILRFDEFEATLDLSRLVQADIARPVGIVMIGLELVIAVWLCFSRTRQAALHVAAPLICLFFSYSVWRVMQDIPLPCHCFGALFTMQPWQSLLLNLALLGLTTWLLLRLDRRPRGRAA